MDMMNEIDKILLEELQSDFPLVSQPFKQTGESCNISEEEVIERINQYKSNGLIRDLAPVINANRIGYKNTLVAVQVDEKSIDEVASKINTHPGVSHNYLRDYKYNVWFTLAVKKEIDFETEIKNILNSTSVTNYLILPSIHTFKIAVNFRFTDKKYHHSNEQVRHPKTDINLSDIEKQIINELQACLDIIPQPWKAIADSLSIPESQLFDSINHLKEAGVIRRISVAMRHRNVGFTSNAMTCFNIPEDKITEDGEKVAKYVQVTHCYHRQAHPDWKYPLFAMIHARSKEEGDAIISSIAHDINCDDYIVLYSPKELKKERVKYIL